MSTLKSPKERTIEEQRQFWRESQIKHRARESILTEIRAAASFIGLDLVQRAGQFAFLKTDANTEAQP